MGSPQGRRKRGLSEEEKDGVPGREGTMGVSEGEEKRGAPKGEALETPC